MATEKITTIDSEPQEVWRDVPGYEGYYSISNRGQVRRDAPGHHTHKGKILKPVINHDGYQYVELCIAGKTKGFFVHRLVLSAFVGPRPKGCQTNHKDFDPSNNRLENLEYMTSLENNRYSIAHRPREDRHYARLYPEFLARGDRHGSRLHPERMARGENNGRAKLTDEAVREIWRQFRDGKSQSNIARAFKVSRYTIYHIVRNKNWKHLI